MQLNKRKKIIREKVVNPEGSIVLGRSNEVQLYLQASNLKISSDSFYATAEEKLKDILRLSNEVSNEYILGLAKFLADKGLKLSPTVLLAKLSDRNYSFRGEELGFVFNTPQRIAETIALHDMGLVKLNNSFYKNVLKPSLESMGEITLKKNKMKNRKVKLADLIKLLHPKPKSEEMAKLYKAIIENTKEASLKDTANIVTVKSSTKLNEEEKKEIIDKDLEKLPINQLIRNLKFIADKYNFSKNIEMQKRIIKKLNSVKDYRFLNIFDVLTAMINVPQMEKALFEVVSKFVSETKKEFSYSDEATILFDISGSMKGEGEKIGFYYIILIALLIDKIKLRTFSDNLHEDNIKLKKVITKIRDGSIGEAHKIFNEWFEKHSNGTALIDSIESLMKEDKEMKNICVVSDEVSWVEGGDLTGRIGDLAKSLKDKKLLLVNPQVYQGTIFQGNVVAISSLNPSILVNLALLFDEQGFIKHISKYKVKT